jgi:hypothetical protein
MSEIPMGRIFVSRKRREERECCRRIKGTLFKYNEKRIWGKKIGDLRLLIADWKRDFTTIPRKSSAGQAYTKEHNGEGGLILGHVVMLFVPRNDGGTNGR